MNIIYDTDMAADVDDVGALALLHTLADLGEAEILAAMVSSRNEHVVPCLNAINTYYGRPDIPIGSVNDGVKAESRYTKAVADSFPHVIQSGSDVPDAARLYRKILADQPDGSVVIVSVGFLTNLKNLLQTEPDEYSDLGGVDLVREKVKLWVCMGGHFPEGKEYNIHTDAAASIIAVRDWPTPVVFSGYEIGHKIMTGKRLEGTPESNPVRAAYYHFNGLSNRESWDHSAVLYAVRGLRDYWDIGTGGYLHINQDGSNEWRTTTETQHSYLIEKMDPAELAKIIEDLMLKPPKG
ncbi:MAG: nucleoside hydrolase [Fidelibacterota bacterium]|nr:MAG: nucleoside hydrolase [Candidatus Neomarinimicrobiota bacterium]